MKIKKLLFCLSILSCKTIFSMRQGSGSGDPFARINYSKAFDQEKFYKNFASLLKKWGCSKNVSDASNVKQTETDKITPQEIEAYKKACLAQLQSARFQCLTEGARNELTNLLILACSTLAVHAVLPPESLGGSFNIFSATVGASYSLPTIIQTAYNLFIPPSNPLALLEEHFAMEKCFIPKEFHPAIIQKFETARTNAFERQAALNFLEFALGLTLYKPKPVLPIEKDKVLTDMRKSVFPKIDSFFSDYDNVSPQDLWILKNNIYTFILALLDSKNPSPRFLYLHGGGGIGKTYFINQLYTWLEELLPGSIKFENFVISNAEELEGNFQRPSAMLRILRNQLLENKRGSFVFMDEATWLSNPGVISSSKRIFNGNQTLFTDYFGKNIEGGAIELKIAPIFICLACNENIQDQALKTRFDTIHFPSPKKETLVHHAEKIASANPLINQKDLQFFDFNGWVEKEKLTNFRDVESQIIPTILAKN